MKKGIKIGTIDKFVNIDGRVKIEVGKRMKVTEEYIIVITEILDGGCIKARSI